MNRKNDKQEKRHTEKRKNIKAENNENRIKEIRNPGPLIKRATQTE